MQTGSVDFETVTSAHMPAARPAPNAAAKSLTARPFGIAYILPAGPWRAFCGISKRDPAPTFNLNFHIDTYQLTWSYGCPPIEQMLDGCAGQC
jgi:hypothetical protein